MTEYNLRYSLVLGNICLILRVHYLRYSKSGELHD